MTWTGRILARLFAVVGVVLVLAIVALAVLGYTAWGNQFMANQIASRISTPDMQLKIDGARGLLAGNFRVDRITVADTRGQFAEVENLALDWTPFSLLTARFDAEQFSASRIALTRAPVTTLEPAPSDGSSFSLPVEIDIARIDLPTISLGEGVMGRNAELALTGSAQGVADRLALTLDARQTDRAGLRAVADLAYAVNAERLRLKLDVNEPSGGMISTLLQLPNTPAVSVSIEGDGPIDLWQGKIRASLDGQQRLALDGSHVRNDAGMQRIVLSGGGTISDLLPPTLRPLFEGENAVDLDAYFKPGGLIDIRSAKLSNGALTLDLGGAVDPAGQAVLNGSLRPAGETIAFRWLLAEGALQADIRNAAITASGPYNSVAFEVSADIDRIALPAGTGTGTIEDVAFRFGSDKFDLATRTGALETELTAESTAFTDPQLTRLVRGPIRLTAPATMAGDAIKADKIELASGAIGGTASLGYDLASRALDLTFKTFAASQALLPPDLAAKAGETIALEGKLTGTPDNLAFENVQLTSGLATAKLDGTLVGTDLTAALTADVLALTALSPDVEGKLALTANVSGPLNNLELDSNLTSDRIVAGGKALQAVDVSFNGQLDANAPGGALKTTLTLDGQPITLTSNIIRNDGVIRLTGIAGTIGGNALLGELALSPDFLPAGQLTANLADLPTLGRLAGQQLDGDMKIALTLRPTGGKLAADITGNGTKLVAQGVTLDEPALQLQSPDLIGQLLRGELRVASLQASGNEVQNLVLGLDHQGQQTGVTLDGTLDGKPLTASADIQRNGSDIDIMLEKLEAAPRGIPIALAEPGFLLLRDGRAVIETLKLTVGTGMVSVSGDAADRLDLRIAAENLPAALANAVSPDLGADGSLSANARITGNATAPVVDYDFTARALTARPLIEAGRAPLDIGGNGKLENNLLTLEARLAGIRETGILTTNAAIRLGDEIRIERFDLAGDGLKGNVTGSFTPASQALQAALQLDVTGGNLLPPDLTAKLNGPLRLTGNISGTPDDLAFSDIKLASSIANADLSGTLKAGTLDATLSGAIADLAAFQPDASGSANFNATVSGPIAAPVVKAEVTAADAVLAGRPLQSLSAKLDLTADAAAPRGTLTATGQIDGQTIDISGDIASDNGRISLPAVKAVVGRNTLDAALTLDAAFLPSGTIRFDLPDIGLLAALGGQQASGDLKGSATLDNAGGKLSAAIKAEGSGIQASTLSIRSPAVDLDIPDLLTGQLSGKVTAEELAAGANRITGLDATFTLQGARTDFTVAGLYDDAPLKLDGNVLRAADGMEIGIDTLTAAPRKLPVSLAAPARIRIANGVTDLGTISLDAAGGRIDIAGRIADTLDIRVNAPALPLALANVVSPELDAAGTISAEAVISGPAANPVASFTIDGKQLTARALSDAGRAPLDLQAEGRFENQVLSAKADIQGIRELGASTITAKLGLADAAIRFNELALTSPVLTARGDGTLQGERVDLRLAGEIINLTNFLPEAKGKADFRIEATGPLAAPDVKLNLQAENAEMAGKALQRLVADITARADPANPMATIKATGTIDNQAIDVSANVTSDQGRITIPDIKANVGRNTISGAIALTAANLPTGKLSFDLPDVALLAALGGQTASGQLNGAIDLTEAEGKINAVVKATGSGITAQGINITNPVIDLQVPDLLAGQITGTIKAKDIVSGANRLAGLDVKLTRSGATTDFDVKGNYDGAPLTLVGALENRADGMVVTLNSFAASPRKIPVKLAAPVSINTAGGGAEIRGLRIATGNGSITVDGTAGQNLNLRIKVASLPASLANSFAAGLDASGTIGADATVTGSSSNPLVNFTVSWQNALTSQIRTAGLSALTVNAKGKLEGTRLTIDTNVRGGGGISLNANGSVDTGGNQALNISVNGRLPFDAVAAQLAAQGLALKGNAVFDLKIGGNAARPDVSGSITTSGAQFIAIRQNLIVNNVAATINLSGQTATIASLSGRLDGGGRVNASGTVGFAPGSGLPADITVRLERATYADGRVVVARVTGELTVKGPLQRDAVLGGTVRLRRADITVPERLPASLANANVKHKNAPADVVKQSREIRTTDTAKADTNKGGGLRLDLRIIAPNQIFVRGRGLDAELGGEVRITGASSAPVVSGGFNMRRGRLSIVSKRLDFSTGEITFGGGMVPYLNMIASTTVNSTTLNVNVTGLANDPAFSFTSSPALPQDEVLAQLIFGRDSSSLSPFQIAQLADAVATLSGGQRTSLFNKLRQGLGVDDLNVGTDENGGAQVTAGKYLNRRTYLELKQGEDESKSGVAINLDIGKGVKLRGEANANGNTSTGIFYEKEY